MIVLSYELTAETTVSLKTFLNSLPGYPLLPNVDPCFHNFVYRAFL